MLARDLTTKRYLFGKCSRMLGPGLLVILIILPIQVGRMAWGCSVRLLSLVHARNSDLVSVGRYPTYQNTSRTVGTSAPTAGPLLVHHSEEATSTIVAAAALPPLTAAGVGNG